MKLNIDFSEFREFADNLQKTNELETALMTATQNVARVFHENLKDLTPVKTGNLRKMWSAGDNLLFTVEPVRDGYEVIFINEARADHKDGVMYGVLVNDGHHTVSGGWVMGRFFVEDAVVMTKNSSELDGLIMKELQKWWVNT
jgi:hypothetical protein